MVIQLYSLVTDGRRTGIVTKILGGHAEVSFANPKAPEAWQALMREYVTIPLVDLRPMELPRPLAA